MLIIPKRPVKAYKDLETPEVGALSVFGTDWVAEQIFELSLTIRQLVKVAEFEEPPKSSTVFIRVPQGETTN